MSTTYMPMVGVGKERPVNWSMVMFAYDSITVSSAWELTSVSMRYSQGDGVNTSLSRLMYCTHECVFGSVPSLMLV